MANLRFKGRDVTVNVTLDGVVQSEFTAVPDFNLEILLRDLDEQYLGKETPDFDEIFDGVRITTNIRPQGNQILELQRVLVDRARGATPNTSEINFTATINFPDGQVGRITVPNLRFGATGINIAGRDQYGNVPLTGRTEDYILEAA